MTKPDGAWTAEPTVDYIIGKVFNNADFYALCPDDETRTVR